MRASNTDPRKLAALVVLLAVLGIVVVYRLRPALVGSLAVGRSEAARSGSYQVPSLGWDADTVRQVPTPGFTRNLFTFGAPPTPTPDLRPTPTPAPTLPPRVLPTPTPGGILLADGTRLPIPPQFPLTFIGWLGPDRLPVAVFLEGSEVVVAPQGTTVKENFILREVGPTEITVGFVGYPETVTRKVSLSQ